MQRYCWKFAGVADPRPSTATKSSNVSTSNFPFHPHSRPRAVSVSHPARTHRKGQRPRSSSAPPPPADLKSLLAMIEAIARYHGDEPDLRDQDLFGTRPWLDALVAEGSGGVLGYRALLRVAQLQFVGPGWTRTTSMWIRLTAGWVSAARSSGRRSSTRAIWAALASLSEPTPTIKRRRHSTFGSGLIRGRHSARVLAGVWTWTRLPKPEQTL